ncbi:MAG: HPr kinase/phosphorylase [Alphaproteobacteria bacterium]
MSEAPRALVHGTAIMLGTAAKPFKGPENTAVLIMGPPGSGKSDLALRLIERGARLIADDQTALFVRDEKLFAESPPPIRGMLEMRGLGVITLEVAPASPLGLVVEIDPAHEIGRMPDSAYYVPPESLGAAARIPLIRLKPFEASAPTKIVAAASAFEFG